MTKYEPFFILTILSLIYSFPFSFITIETKKGIKNKKLMFFILFFMFNIVISQNILLDSKKILTIFNDDINREFIFQNIVKSNLKFFITRNYSSDISRLIFFCYTISYGMLYYNEDKKERIKILISNILPVLLFSIFHINSIYYIIPKFILYNRKQGRSNNTFDIFINASFFFEEFLIRNSIIYSMILIYSGFKNIGHEIGTKLDSKIIYNNIEWVDRERRLLRASLLKYLFIHLNNENNLQKDEKNEFCLFLKGLTNSDIIYFEDNGLFVIAFSRIMEEYGVNPLTIEKKIEYNIESIKEQVNQRLNFPILASYNSKYSPTYYFADNFNEWEKFLENTRERINKINMSMSETQKLIEKEKNNINRW